VAVHYLLIAVCNAIELNPMKCVREIPSNARMKLAFTDAG
jgi:hypothetical protein